MVCNRSDAEGREGDGLLQPRYDGSQASRLSCISHALPHRIRLQPAKQVLTEASPHLQNLPIMPQNQAAWLTQAKSPLEIQSAPYNEPGTHEIVIKNHAVAINPVDWQMQDEGILIEQYPTVFGCDVDGTVEAIGSAVDLFQVGDRVIG